MRRRSEKSRQLPPPGAVGQRSIFMQQVSQTGIYLWGDTTWSRVAEESASNGEYEYCHVRIWMFHTDQGGEPKAFSRMLMAEIKDKQYEWANHEFCKEHIVHLIVKSQINRRKVYWSILAKTINTWRTKNNAKKLYQSYVTHFGVDRAREVAGRLPPRPLKGRWGDLFPEGDAGDDANEDENDRELDVIEEEAQAYSRRARKWLREAYAG
eukprot:9472524-Pyramimonas_sp.AAC.1